jgi:hypothetical protein
MDGERGKLKAGIHETSLITSFWYHAELIMRVLSYPTICLVSLSEILIDEKEMHVRMTKE